MKDLDLNDVRTFVAVTQAGTLTAAAKELQLPTSTVSRSLTRLEQHLGVLLVQRSPRGLVLTDSGKEYLQSCRRALRALKDGSELLERHRSSPSGLIKVACPITMARDVLAPLMMCSSNCWRRRIPCDAYGHIQAPFEGFSPAQAMSERRVIRRLPMTSPLTSASVPEPGS
jgi:molybdenum-dependent DNA-binding transcriptional regulator ModE